MQSIGLVELEHVARHLSGAGVEVVGGGAFQSAGEQVSLRLQQGPLPVLVAEREIPAPGTRSFYRRLARHGSVVMVRLDGATGTLEESTGLPVVTTPITIDELLATVGVAPLGGAAGAARVLGDGTVESAPSHPAPDVPDSGMIERYRESGEVTGNFTPDSHPIPPSRPVRLPTSSPANPLPAQWGTRPLQQPAGRDPWSPEQPVPEAVPPAWARTAPTAQTLPWAQGTAPDRPAPVTPAWTPHPPTETAPTPTPQPSWAAPAWAPLHPAAQTPASADPEWAVDAPNRTPDLPQTAWTTPAGRREIASAQPRQALPPVLFVFAGKGGVGKSQPLDSAIPVPVSPRFPTGWATMGTLELADEVYANNGDIVRVDFFSAVEERGVYDVRLDDGQSVRASDHHLWEVESPDGGLRVVETTDLRPGMRIRLTRPIDGVSDEDDVAWQPGDAIPARLLRASVARRRATWTELAEWSRMRWLSGERLALSLPAALIPSSLELARSLGFHASRTDSGIEVRCGATALTITGVEESGREPVRCLRVDHPSHMYLTSGFVPTHNTTVSRHIAEHAAASGRHVVFVDGNAGQGDQRTFLRLTGTDLPSIFDVATGAVSPAQAILTPRTVNGARPSRLPAIHFALVLAPPHEDNDRDHITPEVYHRVIEEARAMPGAELVVVDTQSVETADVRDPRQVVGGLIVPMVREEGAWALGLTEFSNESTFNLSAVIAQMIRQGCPPDHLLTALTKVAPGTRLDSVQVQRALGDAAPFIGVSFTSPDLMGHASAGKVDIDDPAIAPLTSTVIERVTGVAVPSAAATTTRKKHWWNRKGGDK